MLVTAVLDVLFVIALVVNDPVVVLPDIIRLLAVKEVAPVPPAGTGNTSAAIYPFVTVYNALLEAVPELLT